MKITLSQSSYSVRDAGEIAFGLLVLGIILIPVAMGVGFFVGLGLAALWPDTEPPAAIVPVCGLLTWLGAMWLVIRRYQRIAAGWPEPRRGKNIIHLIEWIAVGIGLLLSPTSDPRANEAVTILRLFFAGLMFMLLLSHVATYALLRYRPQAKEIIVWCALVGSLIVEMCRHA